LPNQLAVREINTEYQGVLTALRAIIFTFLLLQKYKYPGAVELAGCV
jgi:hypothetical protein